MQPSSCFSSLLNRKSGGIELCSSSPSLITRESALRSSVAGCDIAHIHYVINRFKKKVISNTRFLFRSGPLWVFGVVDSMKPEAGEAY